MIPINYLTLHSSNVASLRASNLQISTLTGSTLTVTTSITSPAMTASTLIVSSINGLLPGTGSGSGTSTWLTGTGGIIYYNSGNVGIGTSADISNFQVYGATNPNITLGNSTYPSDFQIAMASAGGNYSGSAIAGDTIIRTISGNLMLQAMGGGTAAIYLSRTNNYVGIGMATPSNLLTVAQLGTNYTSPVVVVDAGIPGNVTAGAPRGMGKPLLGIGNSSWTSGGVAGDYYGIGFGYGGAASGSYYPAEIGLYVQTTSGSTWGDIVFSARGVTSATIAVERMRITGGGFVGINNAAPAANLDVTGSLRITSQTYAAITSGTGVDIIYSGAGQISCGTRGVGGTLTAAAMNYAASGHTFFTGASAGTNSMTITSTGNVGIGTTSPLGMLQVGHATLTGAGTSDGNIVIGKTTGVGYRYAKMGYDADFNFCMGDYGVAGGLSWITAFKMAYSAPVNSLTVDGTGRVGIGIAIPGYALHVVGAIFATGDITAFSDQRYKQNIVRLDRSLDKIRSLSGYSYTRADYRPGERQIGLLAQEVKAVLPEAVSYDSTNDTYSVNYNCLMAPVVEAIKELSDRVEAQQVIIQAQQSVIQKLLDRLGPE